MSTNNDEKHAMNQETLDRLCAEARQRLAYHINRSAGQHLRAMRRAAYQKQAQITMLAQMDKPTTPVTPQGHACDELVCIHDVPGCATSPGAPKEAGNVWFDEPEPEALDTVDAIAIGVLLLAMGSAVAGGLFWFADAITAASIGV